jgi:hypothetical protein
VPRGAAPGEGLSADADGKSRPIADDALPLRPLAWFRVYLETHMTHRKGSATPPDPDPKAAQERACETISASTPGNFKNDPDDPTNPNEAIERSRRTLRRASPDRPPRTK